MRVTILIILASQTVMCCGNTCFIVCRFPRVEFDSPLDAKGQHALHGCRMVTVVRPNNTFSFTGNPV